MAGGRHVSGSGDGVLQMHGDYGREMRWYRRLSIEHKNGENIEPVTYFMPRDEPAQSQ